MEGMRFAVRKSAIASKAAGLWLRCFLGGVILALSVSAYSWSAQIDIPGPERLTHVEGQVVNDAGRPATDLEVTLTRDEKVVYRTRTDKSGAFRFEHVSGAYVFQVARSESAPAVREIVVTDEIVTNLQRKKLYVILGPGACKDECSSVLTSKKDFERAIREKNKH
jgi:Carboxypeptidase regulatory-like domain